MRNFAGCHEARVPVLLAGEFNSICLPIPFFTCNIFSSACRDIGSSSKGNASQAVMAKPATVGFFCNRTKQLMKILDGNGDKGRFESLIGQCRRSRWPICRRPSLKSECWFHLIMFSRFKIPHSDRPAGKRTQNGRDGRHAK